MFSSMSARRSAIASISPAKTAALLRVSLSAARSRLANVVNEFSSSKRTVISRSRVREALQKPVAVIVQCLAGWIAALGRGMKQLTLAAVGFERYAKTTRRAAFLAEMERVVPWSALCALIEPFYPKPGNGRPPVGVERMLRIYFLQQWFNLLDPAVEEALSTIRLRCAALSG